jgi:hypothetical protein
MLALSTVVDTDANDVVDADANGGVDPPPRAAAVAG